ncbi:hypothetical protein FQ626_08590 [Erwinia pyrifoliae]|nr:hypothetical protein [Erwinia pyrifoliae]
MFRITSGFEQAENAKILTQLRRDHEMLSGIPASGIGKIKKMWYDRGNRRCPFRFSARRDVHPARRSLPLLCAAGRMP